MLAARHDDDNDFYLIKLIYFQTDGFKKLFLSINIRLFTISYMVSSK